MNKTTLKVDPGKQELFIYREFDAPRDLVFKTFTDPKLLEQWMNPCRPCISTSTSPSMAALIILLKLTLREGNIFFVG